MGSEMCIRDRDTVDGGGPQPLGAIEVERGVVPGLDHQIAGLDFAGTGLGYVLAVRGAVEHIAGFLCLLNNKAEGNRKNGKGRAQIKARNTGGQNEKGDAQRKQQQHAKNNGSNGRSEQGRMWRENDKTKERRTTKRTKMMAG